MSNPIVVHVRRLANFEPGVDDWLDEQFAAATSLFWNGANLQLLKGSDKTVPISNGTGMVKVEQCQMFGIPTPEQLAVFQLAGDVPANDIVAFIVLDFFPWQGGGCAWHPPGMLGCMVTKGQVGLPKWKLAHEIGHVLGLFHSDFSKRLMYHSVFWDRDPPLITQAEREFLNGDKDALPAVSEGSLAISEMGISDELRKIEPNYRSLSKLGSKGVSMLRRFYEADENKEYKSRAVHALSLVTREFDDVLVSAAAADDPQLRRAAAAAAGRLLPRATAKRILLQLEQDPDPSVRYVTSRYVPVPTRRGETHSRRGHTLSSTSQPTGEETLCQQGGPEITAATVAFSTEDEIAFRYMVCKSTPKIQVHLVLHEVERQLLADEEGRGRVNLRLPKLPPGRHLLYWGFQESGFEWETRAELLVNGTCRFRHRKSHSGNDPVNRGFLVLDVSTSRPDTISRIRRHARVNRTGRNS